jgi:S1-C subfamily serine protease
MKVRILIAAILLWPLTASADEARPDLEALKAKGIVVVIASTVDTEHGNVPVSTHGTGFFISAEGFLVTSFHLRTKLPNVPSDQITYAVRFGSAAATASVPAAVLWENELTDIIVLSVAIGEQPIAVLARSSVTRDGIKKNETPLFTGGYPHGLPFVTKRGTVLGFGLVDDPRPAWITDLTFGDGQSGSPVVLGDGAVVALARGNVPDAPGYGVIVPIRAIPEGLWDRH